MGYMIVVVVVVVVVVVLRVFSFPFLNVFLIGYTLN